MGEVIEGFGLARWHPELRAGVERAHRIRPELVVAVIMDTEFATDTTALGNGLKPIGFAIAVRVKMPTRAPEYRARLHLCLMEDAAWADQVAHQFAALWAVEVWRDGKPVPANDGPSEPDAAA